MPATCRSCQRTNRDDAKFCDACGKALSGAGVSAPPLPAPVEFRYGTFLFCDMVQSTALANRIDLEDLRHVFRWFREQVGVVANQHGGNIIRFVGDGAFLSFGLPQATGDAPEAAVPSPSGMARPFLHRSQKPATDAFNRLYQSCEPRREPRKQISHCNWSRMGDIGDDAASI